MKIVRKCMVVIVLVVMGFLFSETKGEETVQGFTVTIVDKEGVKKATIGGDTAEIFQDGRIRINNVVARIYGDTQTGDTLVHTSSGVYDRLNNVVTTNQFVRITRVNMEITGTGLRWFPNKEFAEILEDVRVEYRTKRNIALDKEGNPVKDSREREVITKVQSSGKMKFDYRKHIVTFSKDVKIDDPMVRISAHTVKVKFGKDGKQIEQIAAYGDVHIIQPERVSYSRKAVYLVPEDKLLLEGYPRIVQGDDLYTADRITIYDMGNRVVFEPSAKLVVYVQE